MVARFTLVVAKRKNDNIRLGWSLLQKLYQNAEMILPPSATGFALKDEPETWPNALRLAQAIVTACGSVQHKGPAKSDSAIQAGILDGEGRDIENPT